MVRTSPEGARHDPDRSEDPLRGLLALLAQAKVRTLDELAGAMDADAGLVAQMLDSYRGGYLRRRAFDAEAAPGASAGLCA